MTAAITLGEEPLELDLFIIPGATFRKTVTVSVGATEASATPVDYTGAAAELHIRDIDDDSLLYTMTTTDGTLTLGADGTIVFYIDPAVSTLWTWTIAHYASLEITLASGDIEAFSYGNVTLFSEHTK